MERAGRVTNYGYRMLVEDVTEQEFEGLLLVVDGNDQISKAEINYFTRSNGETRTGYLMDNVVLVKGDWLKLVSKTEEDLGNVTRKGFKDLGTGVLWQLYLNSVGYYAESLGSLKELSLYRKASKHQQAAMEKLLQRRLEGENLAALREKLLSGITREVLLEKLVAASKVTVAEYRRLAKIDLGEGKESNLQNILMVIEGLGLQDEVKDLNFYDYIEKDDILTYLLDNRFTITVDKVLKHYRTNYFVIDATLKAYNIELDYYSKKNRKNREEDLKVQDKVEELFEIVRLRDQELKTFEEIGEEYNVIRQSAYRTYMTAKKRYPNLLPEWEEGEK